MLSKNGAYVRPLAMINDFDLIDASHTYKVGDGMGNFTGDEFGPNVRTLTRYCSATLATGLFAVTMHTLKVRPAVLDAGTCRNLNCMRTRPARSRAAPVFAQNKIKVSSLRRFWRVAAVILHTYDLAHV